MLKTHQNVATGMKHSQIKDPNILFHPHSIPFNERLVLMFIYSVVELCSNGANMTENGGPWPKPVSSQSSGLILH